MSELTTKDALLERMAAATDDLKDNLQNVERVDSSGTNYIRYTNGVQICWGNGVAFDTDGTPISLPAAFKDATYAVSVTGKGVASSTNVGVIKIIGKTTNTFTVKAVATANLSVFSSGTLDYVAIGWWK